MGCRQKRTPIYSMAILWIEALSPLKWFSHFLLSSACIQMVPSFLRSVYLLVHLFVYVFLFVCFRPEWMFVAELSNANNLPKLAQLYNFSDTWWFNNWERTPEFARKMNKINNPLSLPIDSLIQVFFACYGMENNCYMQTIIHYWLACCTFSNID